MKILKLSISSKQQFEDDKESSEEDEEKWVGEVDELKVQVERGDSSICRTTEHTICYKRDKGENGERHESKEEDGDWKLDPPDRRMKLGRWRIGEDNVRQPSQGEKTQ